MTYRRKQMTNIPNPVHIRQEIEEFTQGFESRFQRAPDHEKKALLKKCVNQVIIDLEKQVARCYVRVLPAVHPHIEALYEGLKMQTAPRLEAPVCNVGVAGTGLEPATFGL